MWGAPDMRTHILTFGRIGLKHAISPFCVLMFVQTQIWEYCRKFLLQVCAGDISQMLDPMYPLNVGCVFYIVISCSLKCQAP